MLTRPSISKLCFSLFKSFSNPKYEYMTILRYN